jgi:hypothetical protein
MRRSAVIVFAIFAFLGLSSGATAADALAGTIRGVVTDTSDGVLPGVTVVASSLEGHVLATTVTDGVGMYELATLPAGDVRLTFQLDGFATAVESVAVRAGIVSTVQKRLQVAPVTETVVVLGDAPRYVPPPPPVVEPVPVHDRDSICGPAKPSAAPQSFGTIRARRSESQRELYAKDDELVIDGGTLDGLEVGKNVVVRRRFRAETAGASVEGEHTAGVIQIVTADERVSSAVVVYACDEVMKGDYLAPFNPEPIRVPDPAGLPAFGDAARVLFADAGQMLGAPRRLMVIDRGSEHGIYVGQRLTLFRRRGRVDAKRSVVGDAVVVAVRVDSATIRVESATDVISSGDWAAPHRPSLLTPPRVAGSAAAKDR